MVSEFVRKEREHLLAHLKFPRSEGTTPKSMKNVFDVMAKKFLFDEAGKIRPLSDSEVARESGLTPGVVGRARKALESLRACKTTKLGTSINWGRLSDFQTPPPKQTKGGV